MSPNESASNRKRRRVFTAVPIAVAGSIAVTMGLVTPAQASVPRNPERSREKAPDTGATPTGAQAATGQTATTRPATTTTGTQSVHETAAGGTSGTVTSTIASASAASPAQTTVAGAPSRYQVQSGDTVSGIAARFGLSTASVLTLNGLSWKSLIFPGQVLALGGAALSASTPTTPPATKYSVVTGDTISGIAGRFGVSTDAVLSANGLSASSLIFPGQLITIPGVATAAVTAPAPVVTIAAPPPAPVVQPGQIIPLTDEMRANARLIVRIGREEGVSDGGIVVALAAAAQESGLRNVRYGDRDSLGLFQQRPSKGWGTADQVLDPERATRAFYGGASNPNRGSTRGLLDIPGWISMSVTQAAQAVQISAYPTAYAKWEASARTWLAELS